MDYFQKDKTFGLPQGLLWHCWRPMTEKCAQVSFGFIRGKCKSENQKWESDYKECTASVLRLRQCYLRKAKIMNVFEKRLNGVAQKRRKKYLLQTCQIVCFDRFFAISICSELEFATLSQWENAASCCVRTVRAHFTLLAA